MAEMKAMADGRAIYQPDGATLKEFILCRKEVSVIQGPIGSGKSKAANMKVYALAAEQRRDRTGFRRSRCVVVRDTYPELKNTTVRTWLDTFPEEKFGRFKWSIPFRHEIRVGDIVLDVDFLALDKEEDIKKLRSGEWTFAYVNELQYMQKQLFDELQSRLGRYPAVKDGGATWSGIIADMNAPEEDHWMAIMTGQVEMPPGLTDEERQKYYWPEQWGFYMQPPGLVAITGAGGEIVGYEPNPKAENVKWLKPGYYTDMVRGKTRGWIDSRIMNVITVIVDGNPVWKNFRPEIHVAKDVLQFQQHSELWVGLDFGRQPAAVFGQNINGRISVLDELQGFDESATVFAPRVKAHIAQRFPNARVRFIGDPKGQDKTQSDERTAYDVFANHGMKVRSAPVPTNNIKTRIDAVDYCLTQLVDGRPKLILSRRARALKMAMQGKYHFRKNDENKVEPVKDRWSNIADALQYLILGMGEGKAMIGMASTERPTSVVAKMHRGAGRRVR